MPLRTRIALLAAIFAISGCMLWPHTERIVPAVTGTVLRNGEPVPGVDVFVVPGLRAGTCAPSKYVGATDSTGHFAIRGDNRFEMVAYFGDRISAWGICIQELGGLTEAYRTFGMGFPPRSFEFACDPGRRADVCQPGAHLAQASGLR